MTLVVGFGFLGVLITGLVVLIGTYIIEMEAGSAIGDPQNPEHFAVQRLEQPNGPEEWAARRAERRERLSILKIAKLVGAALVTIGALGFYFVQLQPPGHCRLCYGGGPVIPMIGNS